MAEVLNDNLKLAVLDGRIKDLDKDIPANIMPVVSDNYRNHFSWNGYGMPTEREQQLLSELVDHVHSQGKKLRFWAAPDHPEAWRLLLDYGVDMINTDKLSEFNRFTKSYSE